MIHCVFLQIFNTQLSKSQNYFESQGGVKVPDMHSMYIYTDFYQRKCLKFADFYQAKQIKVGSAHLKYD